MYDAEGDLGITSVHLCSCVLYISIQLCGLLSTI